MKILVIGGNGTIGNVVTTHFSIDHEVLVAARKSGNIEVDITDSVSIQSMFEQVGIVDAVICIAGEAKWAKFQELSEDDFHIGIRSKLMGQINLTRIGQNFLAEGGSITLSTGILADIPVLKTTSAAMVNGGIHSFVQAAALELENNQRINVVSLGMVQDAYEKYKDYFPGHNPVPMSKVVNAYVRCVLGRMNGQIIREYE